MKIKVKRSKVDGERGLRRINLWIPNCFMRGRLFRKIIVSGIESRKDDCETPIISADYVTHDLIKTLYGALKTVMKEHGHFNLVEAETSDGTKVTIRV